MAEQLMCALQYFSYGGGDSALKHVQMPIPVPQKGEILVKIETASVNPVDWKIQSGALKPFLPPKFPYVPGTDIAGEVVAAGPGVTKFKEGDKVISWLGLGAGGSLAEFAIAPIKSTVEKPQEITSYDACCLPVAGLTALQAIRDYAGINVDGKSSANLLITGASGGVGLYAVQIAKLSGAYVTATCGARNIELVKSLGADEVVDYKSAEGAELRSPSGRSYDAVIHCTSGISWSTLSANLKPVGKVIDLTPNIKSLATSAIQKLALCHHQELVPFVLSGKAEDLELLAGLARDGKLKTIIDSQYPLSRAEEAWARSIQGHATGKVVVIVK